MKKITSLLMSLLLMFSLTTQAFAAGNDLNEEYLSLDEVNEQLDDLRYLPGYTTVHSARAYYDEDGSIVIVSHFSADGSSGIRPRDAAAQSGRANSPKRVSEPYEQRSYYDTELGTVVTERIYSNGNISEQSESDNSNVAAAQRIVGGEKWEASQKTHSWNGGTKTYYYAEGLFKYDGEEVTVSNADGDYDVLPWNMVFLGDKVSINYGGKYTPDVEVSYQLKYDASSTKKTLNASVTVDAYGNVTCS